MNARWLRSWGTIAWAGMWFALVGSVAVPERYHWYHWASIAFLGLISLLCWTADP